MISGFKNRKPWASGIIALILGPEIGMFYLNRGKIGLVYLLILAACDLLPFAMAFYGVGAVPLIFDPVTIALIVCIVGIVHCVIVAKRFDVLQPLRWYARWYGVLPLSIALGWLSWYLLLTYQSPLYRIPSASMTPTICIGDRILTDRYMHGLHAPGVISLPPERGDVVTFSSPKQPENLHVKRVIGLPGDTVQMKNGELIINGTAIPKERIEDFICRDKSGNKKAIPQYMETLPNGRFHYVLDETDNGPLDNTQTFTVPPRHYFLLGDNRDQANDSRQVEKVGFIPEENIIGKVEFIYWSGCREEFTIEPVVYELE